MKKTKIRTVLAVTALACLFSSVFGNISPVFADDGVSGGGGYALSGENKNIGYMAQVYDSANGLPASEANYILSASSGYIWIAAYSGIIRYDGSSFERQNSANGLTNGRGLFEDSKGRIWVGTNDNGVVVIDNEETVHFTYKDGLPSSSIRTFAEDPSGNIFIGTTAGIAYADAQLNMHTLYDERLSGKRVLKLMADKDGLIYGQTTSGSLFSIENAQISEYYENTDLGIEKVNTLLIDPENNDKLYIGTSSGQIYYGSFGDDVSKLRKISSEPLDKIQWLEYACGKVWVASRSLIGYLDENKELHFVNFPELQSLNNSIEMLTQDYQGNIWLASSTQGVVKIVSNNFTDISSLAGIEHTTYNATCLYNGELYLGTDNGLCILDKDMHPVKNEFTEYIGDTRIRCITADPNGDLWLSTFTNSRGLICRTKDGEILSYNTENGMPSNEIRCARVMSNGDIIAGTNGGLAVIRDHKIIKTVDADSDIKTTVFITVEEGGEGEIFAGTDGDGIYVITDSEIKKIGRDDGLTSDVIVRIIKDRERDLYWIITSNSIEYMKDGIIHNISTFPFSDNYDTIFDENGNVWVVSSYGIYTARVEDMLADNVSEYRLYTAENGLASAPTSYAYSAKDEDGNVYIPGRKGINRVNINAFFETSQDIKLGLRSVYFADEKIMPDENGVYTIPSGNERIRIMPAVFDYTLSNPIMRMYLEGSSDEGITVKKSDITALEYTNLKYGSYLLHLQILDNSSGAVLSDETFSIVKKPRIFELLIVKLILIALLALLTGLGVWRVLTGTVIRRQYKEITQFRAKAERANNARFRFLANMSNDIRTPINTIIGMNEMILREDHTNVPKGYFMSVINYAADIKNASEMLLEFVDELLDMARIESGDMTLARQEYDTVEFLRSIVNIIHARSAEKNIMFNVDIAETLPSVLRGDEGKIKQIIMNLLSNAVKYTDIGEITFKVAVDSASDEHCKLRVSVKDTGIGIKQEDVEDLFNVYEKLDKETKRSTNNSGLGLDISKKFAELMGGELSCKSVYGEGSEFIFTFEQETADKTPIGKFDEDYELTDKGPYVPQFIAPDADILVVDDNPMNLSVIKELLKATKMFVTLASSGEECIEKIKFGSFNMVLLDHIMPGMDGIETMAVIRKKYPKLPVYAMCEDLSFGKDYYLSKGFSGLITKPINSRELEKAIMRHIPEEIMLKRSDSETAPDLKKIPEDLLWINDVEGISAETGIKNSGGVTMFLDSLKLFYAAIDDISDDIEQAYYNKDLTKYSSKMRIIKNSAMFIGATELCSLAKELERAAKTEDMYVIRMNTDKLLSELRAYKNKLSGLE